MAMKKVLNGVVVDMTAEEEKEFKAGLPTDSEISANELAELRDVRNDKLAECDWIVTMHKELGTNIPTAWKTYRQALRDITDSATSLDDVSWPEKPE